MVNFTFTVKQYKLSDHACFWLLIKNHIIWYHWVGFRISLSLSREGAIFEMRLRIYFSCSHLARRDRDYHKTILVFRDENETKYCYSHVSRRDRDFRKLFLVVEREKIKVTFVKNSRDREFLLTIFFNTRSRTYLKIGLPLLLNFDNIWHCVICHWSTSVAQVTMCCLKLFPLPRGSTQKFQE